MQGRNQTFSSGGSRRRKRRVRGAQGAEKRDAKASRRWGIPLPTRLGDLGERRKLPQAENDFSVI